MTTKSKTGLFPILAFLAAAVTFVLGWWIGRIPSDAAANDDETAIASPSETQSEVTWTCSMHPQIRQPNPGQCPLCGMDLIPAAGADDNDHDSELPQLRVSARSAALMNIQTWPVERRTVEREVRLLGSVNFDETLLRTVTAWVPGRLDRLLVNIEGARVEQGDPIAEIYSPALISAQEEFLQTLRTARTRENHASPMAEAARERLRLLGLDARQIREIEERGTVEDHVTIYSPLDGVITRRVAVEGTWVQPGDQIAELAALDRVFVDLEAFERDLPWLSEGQTVRFSIEGLAREGFEGHIAQINPFIDRERRTARARVLVENPDNRLMPGMFARAIAVSRLGDPDGPREWRELPPLVIPASAALITGRRAIVYVQIPDADRPAFELREVDLGPRAGTHYVIRDGLVEGELVVTNGNFKIDAELQLRGRPSMMAPKGGAQPVHDHGAIPVDPREEPTRHGFADEIEAGFGDEIVALTKAYLSLTEALAADDETAARSSLKKFHEQLLGIGKHRLQGNVHMAWMAHYDNLHRIAHELEDAPDIEGLRGRLQELTREVESIHVNFGNDTLPLYRAYCPMALNDRGATWLQTNQTVNNPYFGAMMLRCGEILGPLQQRN